MSRVSKVIVNRQKDRQTDATEIIYHVALWVVENNGTNRNTKDVLNVHIQVHNTLHWQKLQQ